MPNPKTEKRGISEERHSVMQWVKEQEAKIAAGDCVDAAGVLHRLKRMLGRQNALQKKRKGGAV